MGEERDEFPVGMRVLAVDDDATCLKILEAMLRSCKYNVTTTNQAVIALKMLKDNKDKFDLIITDVHMPDMDGFKLMELIGLEMDFPVIMLSANDDTKVVMKGIEYGACDYLIKPVRMEELRNIWQHVLRKKKSVKSEHNSSDNGTLVVGQGPITSGSSEHKLSRKRKEQNEEEHDDSEEHTNENETTSTQKKARVVWSHELHRKFMNAVHDLGLSKAVPKKILYLMNVEGLTRENVASHLQKYRLYLKKMANQDANIVAAMSVRDSYLPLAAVDNFASLQSFSPPSQLSTPTSLQPNGGLSKKEPILCGNNNNIALGVIQASHNQIASSAISDFSKLQHDVDRQQGEIFQGMPTNLGVDRFQHQKRPIPDSNGHFPVSFTAGLGNGGLNNPLTLQAHNSSIRLLPSTRLGSFELNAGVPSNLLNPARSNATWQSAISSSGSVNALPGSSCISSVASQNNSSPQTFSPSSSLVAPASHPLVGNTMTMMKGTNEDLKYLNFGSVGNTPHQWREAKNEHTNELQGLFNPSFSVPLASQSVVVPTSQIQRLNNGMPCNMRSANINGHADNGISVLTEHCIGGGQLKFKDDLSDNSTEWLNSSGYNFDELGDMIKSEREGDAASAIKGYML